jgi:hypothetical protein
MLGIELGRTMTLTEGSEKCDFRFKREMAARSGWPPPWLESQQKEGDKATGRPLP